MKLIEVVGEKCSDSKQQGLEIEGLKSGAPKNQKTDLRMLTIMPKGSR